MSTDTPKRAGFGAAAPLRQLWPYVRPYRGLVALWLGALALSSLATLSLPVAVRFMIDRGFAGEDPAAVDRWFLGLLAVAVLLAVATALRFFTKRARGKLLGPCSASLPTC